MIFRRILSPFLLFVFSAAAALPAAPAESIVTNGDFEKASPDAAWPDGWTRPTAGGMWVEENGNHFLRFRVTQADETASLETRHALPPETKALDLRWRQRLTDVKQGAKGWAGAGVSVEFADASGKKIDRSDAKPAMPKSNASATGWAAKRAEFLVPPEAAFVILNVALIQIEAGSLDLDDITLTPSDPERLRIASKNRATLEKLRTEVPDPSKFPPALHVEGTRLFTAQGAEVRLQGVSTSGMETLSHDFQSVVSVVTAIEQWNANIMRLPVTDKYWFGRGPDQTDGGKAYREQVDLILTLAANRGAYLLIDLHRFRAPRAEDAVFWRDVANRYKNHPAALFDLFNEPHGVSWDVWRNGGFVSEKTKPGDEDSFLSPEELIKLNKGFHSIGMQALVKTVRDTGARNVIVASGLVWSYDLTGIADGYALDDLGGNGIIYAWHVYNWHRDWEKNLLAAAQRFPILVAEVGADVKKMNFIPLEAQEDPHTWVPDMLGFIQKHRLNWTAWCFHPGATPVLISDWNYTPTPFWGVYAKAALAGKKFELRNTR
jgi:hypothetical protein